MRLQREGKRLSQEEERLAEQRELTDREETILDEEQRRTESSIKAQTEEESETKQALTAQINDLGAEIMALERLVAEKKHEERRLRGSLEEVEARIVSVSRKFEKQLGRIGDKKEAVLSARSELQLEELTLETERACHARNAEEAAAARQDWEAWAEDIEKDCTLAGILGDALSYVLREEVFDVGGAAGEGADAEEGQLRVELEGQLRELGARQADLTAKREAAQTQYLADRAEAVDLTAQLPQLEVDKKAHAGARRFKEAGVVSKEIKDKTARKEVLDVEAGASDANLVALSGDLAEMDAKLGALRQQLVDLDRQNDAVLLNRFLRYEKTLQVRFLDRLQDENLAVTSGHQVMVEFRAKALLLLGTEVAVLRENIELLRAKHSQQPLSEEAFEVSLEVEEAVEEGAVAPVEEGADAAMDDVTVPDAESSTAVDVAVGSAGGDVVEEDPVEEVHATAEVEAPEADAEAEAEAEAGAGADTDEGVNKGAAREAQEAQARAWRVELDRLEYEIEEATGDEDYDKVG